MPSTTEPQPAVGDYKSIAAQYARAKALKEKEDAAAKRARDEKTVEKILSANGIEVSQGDAQRKAIDRINERKTKDFKTAWNWTAAIFTWFL